MFSQAPVILSTGGVWQTPPERPHPLGRHPDGQTHTPAGQTPPTQCMLGYSPCPVHAGIHTPHLSPRRPLQQTVRILLECILVYVSAN